MDGIGNIIFVGGIHGVGKTTICNDLSNKLSIEHYSSSSLISMLDSKRIKQDKIVEDIHDNQKMLLEAIDYFLDEDKAYLLDGHFCLIDKNNSIQKVPVEVFESLAIRGIIIISEQEHKILKRLKVRDNEDYSLDYIKEFQEKEIYYAKQIARQIKVPIKIINISKDKSAIISSVKELLQ